MNVARNVAPAGDCPEVGRGVAKRADICGHGAALWVGAVDAVSADDVACN